LSERPDNQWKKNEHTLMENKSMKTEKQRISTFNSIEVAFIDGNFSGEGSSSSLPALMYIQSRA